jgi:DNA-binding transcriptional ArsR family regulator
MKNLLHPTVDQLNLPTLLKALGDATRLEILKALSKSEETTCSNCNIDMSKPALSHHYRVLRESGLIYVRVEGKQRFLSIRYDDVESRFPGLLNAVLGAVEIKK